MKLIVKIEEYFVVALLAILILLVFFAAVFRWFGVSVAWSVDIAQMLFVWVCFIGSDLALRQNKHVGLYILTQKLPPVVQNFLALVLNFLMLAFCAVVAYFGTLLAIQNYQRLFNTLPISYSFVTIAAAVGCLLMATTILRRIYQNISNFIKRDYSKIHYAEADDLEELADSQGGDI